MNLHVLRQTPWDAIVVGGGPAGAACAIQLARNDLKVLLLEQRSQPAFKLGETIAPRFKNLLECLLTSGHHVISETPAFVSAEVPANVTSWGQDGLAEQSLLYQSGGSSWRIDRARLESDLQRAAVSENVTVLQPAKLLNFSRERQWVLDVRLDGHAIQLHSWFLVDATGRKAWVARQCGARILQQDALIARARCFATDSLGIDQDYRTWIEAGPTGWWYSALLSENRRLVVWHTDPGHAPFLQTLRQSRWIQPLLAKHHYQPEMQDFSAPAWGQVLDCAGRVHRSGQTGWIAVGDAAMAMEPLTGQGIGSAISSGCAAGNVIGQVLICQDKDAMQRYQRMQQQAWTQYRHQHDFYYRQEQRWSQHVFWQKRHHTAGYTAEEGGR